MQKELELIKFTLKKELFEMKKNYNLNEDKELLLKIKKAEEELLHLKSKFIKEFRLANKEQIEYYLKEKNHD